MIISRDAEKAFDKIHNKNSQQNCTPETHNVINQYYSNRFNKNKNKTPNKVDNNNITKAIYDKHTTHIILNGAKLKAFSLR